VIRKPNIIIAAQSAPGDGTCTKRSEVRVETHDVIIRYFLARTGDIS
jgi:pectate lyase